MPSARAEIQPSSASTFKWRLTVDCGACSTAQRSATVSSRPSSRRSARARVGSASDPIQRSMPTLVASPNDPFIRMKSYSNARGPSMWPPRGDLFDPAPLFGQSPRR